MTRLIIDENEIRAFADGVFRHASAGQFISIRIFDDGGSKPLAIQGVRINGDGLEPVIKVAALQAQFSADHCKTAVFCPPLAGFRTAGLAGEADLTEGYTLSVECDARPDEARQRLEDLLGPATIVVASGGTWTNPATGEVQDKLHFHWRLMEPAIGIELRRLKEARQLAARLVGADPTTITIVHPMRWPGSWHRKGEPKLARIVSQTEHEINLVTALNTLREASPTEQRNGGPKGADERRHGRLDERSTAVLIANIISGEQYHASVVPLASRLVGSGMRPGAAVNLIRELLEAVPP
jgi:hypothetical protein